MVKVSEAKIKEFISVICSMIGYLLFACGCLWMIKYCGGKLRIRGISGIVAVTWMWDPGGGILGILAFVLLPAGTWLVLVALFSIITNQSHQPGKRSRKSEPGGVMQMSRPIPHLPWTRNGGAPTVLDLPSLLNRTVL